jgi:hypothetical protein
MKRDDLGQHIQRCAPRGFWLAVTRGGGRWLDCLHVLTLDAFTISVIRTGGAVETFLLDEVAGCGPKPAGAPWANR